VKSGAFTMWVDRQMPGGTGWDEDIDRELRACDVLVFARFRELHGFQLHHR
jgi:hypothetical protein